MKWSLSRLVGKQGCRLALEDSDECNWGRGVCVGGEAVNNGEDQVRHDAR